METLLTSFHELFLLTHSMYRKKKVTVYFPCRNEAKHLTKVFKKIPKFVDEIIVVSNCSTDDTVKVAKKLGAIAVEDNRVDKNGIGYGFAHQTGMNLATGDIIIPADGDCTYPVHKIQEIIDYMIDHELDFVNCNRYPVHQEDKIPLMLQVGVNILNLETNLLFHTKISDILSGMWLINKKAVNTLQFIEGGWDLSPEIKIKAATDNRIRFREYKIRQDIREGSSHQNHWQTGFGHLSWIFRYRISTLFARYQHQVFLSK
jgi:glycosyltransferase involved in cell wall biosynthesis